MTHVPKEYEYDARMLTTAVAASYDTKYYFDTYQVFRTTWYIQVQ